MRASSYILQFAILLYATAAWGGAREVQTVVLLNLGLAAHREALEGIRKHAVGDVIVIDLQRPDRPGARAAVASPSVVLALGADALKTAVELQLPGPIITAMTLRADSRASGGPAPKIGASIYIDVPFSAILSRLKQQFPGKLRLALVHNRVTQGEDTTWLESQSRQYGYAATIVECTRPDELLRAFSRLRGKVDFVVTFPDSTLYNGSTVKPLVTASLENRLPIVGFSASFVAAGAAVGVYPDFRDIGAQTVEAANRVLDGHGVREEGPRTITAAVNLRIMRLLGLEYKERADGVVVVR